jgi:hypothetical protein
MKFIVSLCVAALVAGTAQAAPQGSWPEEYRGGSLPVPQWVMVIPARRLADGRISVWDRADEWTRTWTVPKATPSGLRTVMINGDSEDKRIVDAAQIDLMSGQALSRLAGKYGAGAIVVAVEDDRGDVALAAWAKGHFPTWDGAVPSADARASTLAAIDAIYSGRQSPEPIPAATGGMYAVIEAQRYNEAIGRMEYRIRPDGSAALEAIEGSDNLSVNARNDDVPPVVDLSVRDGRDVEQVLSEIGVRFR